MESIAVALSVNCTTGMISFFIFALLMVTKDRIYSIVEKPAFFVLLTIGLDLLLVINSAVLSIPVISNFITNTLGKDITLTGRMDAYARFFFMMSRHYLLGYGLDHNYWVCLKGLTSNSLLPIYNAQNGIFDSIVSYGLIGTIVIFLVSCEMIKKGRKKSDYAFLCGIYVFCISLILCQTEKGIELVKSAGFELEEVDLDKAVTANHQLRHPSEMPDKRNTFFENIDRGFHYAISKCYPKMYYKRRLKTFLQKTKIIGGGQTVINEYDVSFKE